MEADWEIELGPGAPVIDACWSGLVDLRTAPEHAHQIAETRALPGLAAALVQLNSVGSSVWTSKCDVWPVEDPVDPYELDAEPGESSAAVACYIDLLPRAPVQWNEPQHAASACRVLTNRLRATPLRACRADLVVRLAYIARGAQALGITAYLTACGADEQAALSQLAQATAAFADTVTSTPTPTENSSPVQ
jgi:hypothetical protein